DEEYRAHVDPEREIEVLRRQVLDGARDADAGRVDEHVEPPEALAVLGHEPLARFLVGDVRGDADRTELLRGGLDLLGTPRYHRQVVALVAQHAPDREPDA